MSQYKENVNLRFTRLENRVSEAEHNIDALEKPRDIDPYKYAQCSTEAVDPNIDRIEKLEQKISYLLNTVSDQEDDLVLLLAHLNLSIEEGKRIVKDKS